ncbi:FCD domain-containing protein [Anaeroselena agilis]|uniref:FCD domain-containing protein n=1 Tax=Anaeroselena agilis TaxID=3063788 RepID=A0ABU3P4Z4_9FIRM|nr:FCD domain-containing protein [Selenomonadales bacterium 4137-cl]
MLSKREKLERDLLTIISDSAQPVGCGHISQILQGMGHSISEATVGRLLRDLDSQGLTDKAGFQGRSLSARGTARLDELTNRQKSIEWGIEFASSLRGHTKSQLLEVLVARRAIESELAYLAAVNRTEAAVAQLREILERQRQALDEGGGAAQEDVDFHSLIARMAGNRVLGAAIALIRQDTQLSPVLEYIRRRVKSPVYIDHQRLAEAIADGRGDSAREIMVEHINNLMKDVEKYWKLAGVKDKE